MNTSFALLNLGGGEIILILTLILILVGSRLLPNSGIEEFKKGFDSGVRESTKPRGEEREFWSRKEIFLIVALVCLTAIEALALSNWLLQ